MFEHRFRDRSELDEALVLAVARRLSDAIQSRGEAVLALSGGSTPAGFFRRLSHTRLPWSKVLVLLVDDRWVPLAHEDSNERMLREALLTGDAKEVRLLSLVDNYPDVEANLARLKSDLAAISTFDVVILGMGLDGHTASLFPCAAQIDDGLFGSDDVLMTSPATAPHQRVTLSRERIANTRFGALHIVGDDKLAVLQKALKVNEPRAFPVTSILVQEKAFELYWSP